MNIVWNIKDLRHSVAKIVIALGNDIQRHLLVIQLTIGTMYLGGWGNWCYAHQYDTNPRKGRKTGRART